MGRGPSWTKEEDRILKDCWTKGETRADRMALVEDNLSNRTVVAAMQRMSILFGKKPKIVIKRGSPRKLKMKRGKYSVKELDILYDCWKDGVTKAKTIELIKKDLPRRTSASAYQQIYTLTRENPRWKKLATRRKNVKDQKKKELEKQREQRKKTREQKKKDRRKKTRLLSKKEYITDNLSTNHVEKIQDMMDLEFFFCHKQKSFTTNIACIFRKFSKTDEYGFRFTGVCDKCRKFDEFIDPIHKMLKGESKK